MTVDQRIRQDARLLAGDPQAAALLECLAEHIFDPALDLTFLTRVCGASRLVRDRLAAKIGSIKAYITELRMMEAERLVRDTEESIADIGKRVGYPVNRTFRRTFQSAHGVTPSEMRQQKAPRPEVADPAPTADDLDEPPIEVDERLTPGALASRIRRRAALGLLDRGRAAGLRFRLRRRHPELEEVGGQKDGPANQQQPQYPVLLTPTGDHLEKIAAGAVFGEVLDLPEAEVRFALLEGVRLGNVTAFRHLFQLCTYLVQWNRDRALTLAELGVQLIEQHRDLMGEEGDDWKALAWTLLGRVQVIAGDDGGAEKSLGFAWEEVRGADMPSWVEIELRRVEGSLRLRQRRQDEAVRALDRAVELGRTLGRFHPDRAQALLERLELASGLSDAEAGFKLCDELEELVAAYGEVPTLWHGFVAYHRGKAFAAAGQDSCAECRLKQAVAVIAEDPTADSDMRLGMLFTFALHELARVAGRGDRLDDCESLLRTVAERYRWLEAWVFEAATEAELAVLCALRGGWAEARQLATASAAFLDDLPFHREAWNAARRLRALSSGGTDAPEAELLEVLAALRRDLDLVRWEITGTQAMPAARARKEARA